jgi:hypothetical protein
VEEKQATEKKSVSKKTRGRTQSQSKPTAHEAVAETASVQGEA